MGKPGQSSFRLILLSRILLLSIPILLAGEYVVYRKARSGFLETARQNLTESAVRKGENIRALTDAIQSNMVVAGEAFSGEINQPGSAQKFVQRMTRRFPEQVQCVQLKNVQTGQIDGSTCGDRRIEQAASQAWPQQRSTTADLLDSVLISSHPAKLLKQTDAQRQLNLVFSVPVYDSANQLQYVLSAQAALYKQEQVGQRVLLAGYTVVIDQDGVILAHPDATRVGRNIAQETNARVLNAILEQAIAGRQEALHLFVDRKAEWLAGYGSVQIPIANKKNQTWAILAIAPIENALYDLQGIQQILSILTIGLIGASLLATIYIARDLAAPLEQLGNYALQICDRVAANRAPKDFKIKELNQLAAALDKMVERLDERAEELETAWQEALAANQLKSEFLATTSHELRTPLNAIIGCVRLVRDGCCDSEEEELEFLQQADDAAIHLLKVINDLLDISKIEAGKVELNLQPVSIPELCQQCLRMIQPGAEKKRLSLSLDINPTLDYVPLDERRVRQMLINLLSNAVKFTPEGGYVKLSAQTGYGYQLEQDNRPDHSPINPNTAYLCLEVLDSGIGIPEERWHLLFRPFQQIDSSLTRKHEGTGLGLALTKRLVELHGGTLSFQSAPDQGSVFRIWLPLLEPNSSKPAKHPDSV
ncbi:MAG: sensor histidine kinase [Leptolyngbyaceae cyanobacterium RU_5_1]|nr:sensor histidine kinase [Leptolyngbyaceae cyanobacterium RU_5_1]